MPSQDRGDLYAATMHKGMCDFVICPHLRTYLWTHFYCLTFSIDSVTIIIKLSRMVASPDDPIVSPHPIKAPGVGVRPIMSQGVSANSVHGHQTHSHSAPQMPLSASPVNEPIAPPMSQLQNMAPSNQNELGDARVGKNGVRPNGGA